MKSAAENVIAGCPVTVWGSEGKAIVLVTGPPAGRWIFEAVQRRMAPLRTVAVDLVPVAEEPSPGPLPVRLLADVVGALGARAVCAHGLAVPVALALSADVVPLLVVTNGPIRELDPVSRALSATPDALLRALFRPAVLRRWLWSSLGLRRLVANPYVMDRDTVVALSDAWVRGAAERALAARWLAGLRVFPPVAPRTARQIAAIWGDSDPLYPTRGLDAVRPTDGALQVMPVPGGRAFHPLERPWALADALVRVLQQHNPGQP